MTQFALNVVNFIVLASEYKSSLLTDALNPVHIPQHVDINLSPVAHSFSYLIIFTEFCVINAKYVFYDNRSHYLR